MEDGFWGARDAKRGLSLWPLTMTTKSKKKEEKDSKTETGLIFFVVKID